MKHICLLLVVLLGLVPAAQAQPALNFPAFSGSYAVAQTSYHLVDEARDEIFTDDPADKRELMVTVYYPTAQAGDSAPYVEGSLKMILSEQLGMAPETWDIIQTGISADAPIAEGSFPVLIFSPGMGTLPLFYTSLLAEIASQGYVVAAMWHPHSTDVIVFPDERIVTAVPDMPMNDLVAMTEWRETRLNVWVEDAIFVLDTLTAFNENDALLAGHLDLGKVGIFGHSFGGATAAEAAYRDARFLAVANMDGTMSGEVAEHGIRQPFMMMQTQNELDTVPPSDEELAALGISREEFERTSETAVLGRLMESSEAGYVVTLREAAHETFSTDLLLFAPAFPDQITPDMIGTIDGGRAYEIITRYLSAFFQQHVRGETAPLLDGTSPDYPEVVFEG